MALLSKSTGGGSDFEPVPEGTHIARCISVVDLGFHDSPWGRKEKVYISFEIPSVRVKWTKDEVEHEGPALVGNTYTNSIHEKSILGQHLVSWRGRMFTDEERKGFDLFTILDVPCMLSITHNTKGERTYANISAIIGLPKGTTVPDREGDLLPYTPQDAKYAGNLDKLPEWLRNKCEEGHNAPQTAPEAAQGTIPPPEYDELDSDIPFR